MDEGSSRCNGIPRSSRSLISARLRIFNRTSRSVDVIWVNYQGVGVRYGTLTPGQFIDVNTFVGHPWIFRDRETGEPMVVNMQEVFLPEENNLRREINITIPLLSLQERCLQTLRRLVPSGSIHRLEIPSSLKSELGRKVAKLAVPVSIELPRVRCSRQLRIHYNYNNNPAVNHIAPLSNNNNNNNNNCVENCVPPPPAPSSSRLSPSNNSIPTSAPEVPSSTQRPANQCLNTRKRAATRPGPSETSPAKTSHMDSCNSGANDDDGNDGPSRSAQPPGSQARCDPPLSIENLLMSDDSNAPQETNSCHIASEMASETEDSDSDSSHLDSDDFDVSENVKNMEDCQMDGAKQPHSPSHNPN